MHHPQARRRLARRGAADAAACARGHARDNAADEARNAERPTAIGINGGLASAVGILGVTLTHALNRSFRVEAGAGLGLSGWQLSLMPQAVFFEGRDHFITGVGVAVAFTNNSNHSDGHPVWLNVDAIGYEHRFPNGLALSGITASTDWGWQLCLFCATNRTPEHPVRGSGDPRRASSSPTGSRTPDRSISGRICFTVPACEKGRGSWSIRGLCSS